MVNLAKECYGVRDTEIPEILKQFSGQGHKLAQEYERLSKLLYKLGKHITLTRKLVQARLALREDFQHGFEVAIISDNQNPNLPSQHVRDLEKIAKSIFPDPDERSSLILHVQRFFDINYVSETLVDRQQSSRRIHAEIKMIDYFDREGDYFLDKNDRYIGCSKPACYLCYHYIAGHPKGYALPPSHQKLYPAWCLPLVRDSDRRPSERFSIQERFLEKITQKLETDLRAEVENQLGPRAPHADSTIGASSTVSTHEMRLGAAIDFPWLRTLFEIIANGKFPEALIQYRY